MKELNIRFVWEECEYGSEDRERVNWGLKIQW